MKKNTLKSISIATGYSISTVSRVLNGEPEKARIGKEAIKTICEEAKRVNYRPNIIAQSLRNNKTYIIGLLIPRIDNPYFSNIASEIILEARKHNYNVILLDTFENEEIEKECVYSLLDRNIDGIIIAPCGDIPDYLEDIDSSKVPIVLIDRYFETSTLSYVCTDNYQSAFDAVNYLISCGHKNILCIRGVPHSMSSLDRVQGYSQALINAGLEENINVVGNDFSITNGYLETKLAIDSAVLPTAIFCLSNTIMLGVMKAISESSLSVPKDISLLSFDNNLFLDYLNPAITRIAQPTKEISLLAVKMVTEKILHSDISPKQIKLPSKIIHGASVVSLL